MAITTKRYLDFAGLKVYDEKVKALIAKIDAKVGDVSSVTNETVHNLAQALAYEIERAKTADEGFETQIGADETAGTILGRLHALENAETGMTPAEVNKLINAALALLIDGAPETFDTLKEIADWIEKDEQGTAQIIKDVAENKNDLAELRPYVDAQDTAYFNAIDSIDFAELDLLFKEKVEMAPGQTIQQALAGMTAGQMLVLSAGTLVTDALTVPAGVTLDANGATISGAATTEDGAVIQNAVFTGKSTVHGTVMNTTFKDVATVDGNAEFINCEFSGGTVPKQKGIYAVAVTGDADAKFSGCRFANKGYSAVYMSTTGAVEIAGCEFACTGMYNPIEGASGTAGKALTRVKITDCVMRGICGNNYVNLYHFADGAVVDIDNLKVVDMAQASEVVRLSNLNSNDATVNVRNLSYAYDTSTPFDEKWTAAFLAQDYSKDGSQDMSKVKLNVYGLAVNGKKVADKDAMPVGKFIVACDVNTDVTENLPTITFSA